MSPILLIPVFPLIGFVLNFFLGRKINAATSIAIGCGSVFLSFLLSAFYFINLGLSSDFYLERIFAYRWIESGDLQVGLSFLFDELSGLMTLIITGIGFLIHVYSIGYMESDPRRPIFFSYLNLFVFFMLILVLSDNLLLLFVGWEGVGLCSYLLIGFYGHKRSAGDAAKKAFVMNRVGDVGVLIAMLMAAVAFGTLNFADLNQIIPSRFQGGEISQAFVTGFCLLLFFGATGKSAQIPLYSWLPDAMEGPTPVSALIHAATMVTSGIYLMVRLSHVFILSPLALGVVAVLGILTALIGALIAVYQNDIKKVLAYSTVSQLGFMFAAVGSGAFAAGMFHLLTHAFFKALLFLAAGAVIHSLHHEQNLLKMGGLKAKLPFTFKTFAVGAYALSGLPFAAGFFSKDEILWNAAFSPHGSFFFLAVGWTASFLTAFYIYRLMDLAFWRPAPKNSEAVKEAPKVMIYPLAILAFFSAFAGFLGLPHVMHFFGLGNVMENLLGGHVAKDYAINQSYLTEWAVILASTFIALAGYHVGRNHHAKIFAARNAFLNRVRVILENKFYVDEFYRATITEPFRGFCVNFLKVFEQKFTAAFFSGAEGVRLLGKLSAKLQSGHVQFYAFFLAISFLVVLWIF